MNLLRIGRVDVAHAYVAANPGLSTRAIADALGVSWSRAKGILSQLRNEGAVSSVVDVNGDGLSCLWTSERPPRVRLPEFV